jgi:ribosomal protein S11
MIRRILNLPFSCLMESQSLFIKHISTTTSVYSGYKRYDRETDSVRQVTKTVQDFESNEYLALPFDNSYGTSSFPTLESHNQVFDGIKYTDLPIVHIKATSNNTIILTADAQGKAVAIQSAGRVGFRNAKKGTNVAAQAAAIALAGDTIRKNVKTVRVCLKGIGPGRLPALKALEMSGLRIVSITDTTPLPHNGNRPKKVRRL